MQYHLRTLLIVVTACCLLAASARFLPPTDLRSAAPYVAMFLLYAAIAVVWSFAYVRAPRATCTLSAVGLCVVFALSLTLCLVVQSRQRARNDWVSLSLHEISRRQRLWDDLHRPKSPVTWQAWADPEIALSATKP